MDRPLIYPDAVPVETDGLWVAKNCMVGLGLLFQDLIGTQTLAAYLPCTPGSGLTVSIGAGRIYSLQPIDATPYSSLAADSHTIVKQGFLKDPSVLACPAPGTAGQSINYLIEATYADVDKNLVTLPYYNASNPLQAYSGPENNGAAQATVRASVLQLQVKAGTAAATGSQVTPTADAGYIGLYVVTVANGASSIVSGDITQITANFLPQGPYVTPATLALYATLAELAATNAALASDFAAVESALALLAPLENPHLTGNPTAPTPPVTDNDTTIATTAFVQNVANDRQNLAPNGWKIFPGGYMQIWGLMTVPATGGIAIDFEATCGNHFPNACFGVDCTVISATSVGVPFVYGVATGGFSADNADGTVAIQTYWNAYGW
jgi:hypothetical protein